MTRYLISFDDGAMTYPDDDLPTVAEAAHKVTARPRTPASGSSAAGWKVNAPASWPLTERSPMARTPRPRRSSADSRSSTCLHTEEALE